MAKVHFDIEISPKAKADLKKFRPFERKTIVDGMETHLSHEPTKESKSRIKKLTQPFWSQFRLRIDDFRVYYDVEEENRLVKVLRIIDKGTDETLGSPNDEVN